MNINIMFAVFLALLLVLSVFQALQIENIKGELRTRITGTSYAASSSPSTAKSTSSSSSSGMVGGC